METKEFNSSYLNCVVDLLNIRFPEKKVSEKSFLWKHYDDFFKNKTIGMIAVDEEKICSFVCFTPIKITGVKNIPKKFYSCAVQATHPKYRRQGIISNLTEQIEKKLGSGAAYIGFSNDCGIKIDKFSKKINYEILGQMATKYVLSLPYKTQIEIKRAEKISVQNDQYSNYFKIAKNDDYLKWRYERNSKNKYEYLEILKDKKIIGYVIYKNDKIKYEVIDLLLTSVEAKLYKEAIKAFAGFSLKKGKIFVSYSYLENKFWHDSFPAISIKNKIGIYFTVKNTDSDQLDPNKWIIQGGDIQ